MRLRVLEFSPASVITVKWVEWISSHGELSAPCEWTQNDNTRNAVNSAMGRVAGIAFREGRGIQGMLSRQIRRAGWNGGFR